MVGSVTTGGMWYVVHGRWQGAYDGRTMTSVDIIV